MTGKIYGASIVDGNHYKNRYLIIGGKMATTARLTGKETNRSVRKTMITALARNDYLKYK